MKQEGTEKMLGEGGVMPFKAAHAHTQAPGIIYDLACAIPLTVIPF